MILKLKFLNSWILYSNINNINYTNLSYKECYEYLEYDEKFVQNEWNGIKIIANNKTIIANNEVYILNDEGKTIERLN